MKCLIVDDMHESIIPLLKTQGIEVDYRPEITREEILSILPAYQGMIIRSKTAVDRALLSHAEQLQFIGRAGAGVDNLDEKALQERDIQLINAPEGNRDTLAEHTIGLLLALLHHIVKADREVRQMVWDREGNRGSDLAGKTVGLLGYGNMGQAFAKKLAAFGCTVLAFDKYKNNYGDQYAKQSTMAEIWENADVFSLHIPLKADTRMMIDDTYLQNFRKNIYLINTARGEVMSMTALCQALKTGKVKGAALDVLENEKLDTLTTAQRKNFNYLSDSSRVILTPHVAGWSYESYKRINEVLAAKINQLISA